MAGIGFELRALDRDPAVSARLAASMHAIWIAAGPVVIAATSLLGISYVARANVVSTELQLFKIAVVYAFLASLLGAAPAVMVGSRLAADAIYERAAHRLPEHFLGAFALGSMASGCCGLAIFLGLAEMQPLVVLASVALTIAASWLWTAVSFIGALRDYRAIGMAFLTGMVSLLALARLAVPPDTSATGLLVVVATSVLVVTCQLTWKILVAYGPPRAGVVAAVAQITLGAGRLWTLAAGALLAAAGTWIDKWVIWTSDLGTTGPARLRHAPLYDYANFIGFLAMLPLLAELLIRRETEIYTLLRRLLHVLLSHATLPDIVAANEALCAAFRRTMTSLLLRQLIIALMLALALPMLADWLPIAYRQMPAARYALLGGVMHVGLLAASSALLLTDSRGSYLAVQAVFLVLNGGLTWVLLPQGLAAAGLGYLIAAVISGLFAYALAHHILQRLPYLIFRRSLQAPRPPVTAGPDRG